MSVLKKVIDMEINLENKKTVYYLIVGLLSVLVILLGIGYSVIDKNIFLLSPDDSGYGYGYGCEGGEIGFAEGTEILMVDGYEDIEDIEEGDILIGYDSEKAEKAEREVLEIVEEERCDVIRLEFDEGNDIVVTSGFFVFTDDGWKEVGGDDDDELELGDEVINEDTTKEVVEITELEDSVSVYNLEVEDDIYFIDDPIMVRYSSCVSDCDDKDCGGDGCGGVCGSCESDESCVESFCISDELEVDENESVVEETPKVEEKKIVESPKKLPVLTYVLVGVVLLFILGLLLVVGYLFYRIFKPSKKKGKKKKK